jgi:glycosyltransferase involved in cell wall biosynthesis
MKIAVMAHWNDETGAAVHAKALVNAWRELGHKVTVFSFLREEFGEDKFTGKDGRYVIRCFGKNFLDPRPILTSEFDIFVVEDLRTLPVEQLARIFPMIKNRARTVHIVHENKLPEEAWFYQFPWDKVVYFDERQEFLKDVYPDADYIPFPCFPIRRGDKYESRKRLGLPMDKKIIFTFCQRGYRPYLIYLCEELKSKAILLFVISPDYEMLEKELAPPWMIVREEGALSDEQFDEYLFASDVVIFHKYQSRFHRLLSSTIFQAMGADCPIFIPQQSEYFQPLKDEVVYYSDTEDLCRKLIAICEDERIAKRVIEAEEVYTHIRSAKKIAEIYIDVFTGVLKERGL